MADRHMAVKGGAGPYEVAAIVAAVQRVLAEEAARSTRPPPPRQHPWVLVGRMRQAPPAPYIEPSGTPVGWGTGPPSEPGSA